MGSSWRSMFPGMLSHDLSPHQAHLYLCSTFALLALFLCYQQALKSSVVCWEIPESKQLPSDQIQEMIVASFVQQTKTLGLTTANCYLFPQCKIKFESLTQALSSTSLLPCSWEEVLSLRGVLWSTNAQPLEIASPFCLEH